MEASDASRRSGSATAEEVLVVTGLPRSGTSLLMQMLRAGGVAVWSDASRPPDADNPRGYWELDRVRRLPRDAGWLAQARGRAVKIVAPLLPHLPAGLRCRAIWAERDLGEVLASQRSMLERRGEGAEASRPDAELARAFAGAAQRARALLDARGIPVLCVAYADAVGRPAEVAAGIDAFLGGGLDVEAMAGAVDPGLYRTRAASRGSPTRTSTAGSLPLCTSITSPSRTRTT